MFYGRGRRLADGECRSSAIWSPWPGTGSAAPSARGVELRRAPGGPIGRVLTRYHLSLAVEDVAGVLARIAAVFAEHDVSIQTVRQFERGADAQLVVVTHQALDAA